MSEASPSLHQRIYADAVQKILSGDWPPGHRIPFEHELTAHYGCSRMTVNKALSQLAAEGLIERRRKAGSFVRQPRAQAAVLDIHDIRAEVEALGLAYAFSIVSREMRRATPADLALFDAGPQDAGAKQVGRVLAVSALHMAAGAPFCLEDRLINVAAVPEAARETFAAQAPGAWLVSRVPWTRAEHRIRAVGAGPGVCVRLGLAAGAPCLEIQRRTWSALQPVTVVSLTYPGFRHELVARFSPPSASA